MPKKYIINILYIIELILLVISTKLAFDWIKAEKFNFEPKIVFLTILITIIGIIISKISKREENMQCPYNSEILHKKQNKITEISLNKLKSLFWKEYKQDLTDKFLFEEINNKKHQLPVIILTKNEVDISKNISHTKDTNEINVDFIRILKEQCNRTIWNNDTYRLMSIDEQSNELRLGKSDYFTTLSSCDIHYYNFMNPNNDMSNCSGKEYDDWFLKLKNIVLYNQLTTVSASLGCSTLLVIKNYKTNKFQYYIVDNSVAKNPANTKHVVPAFMVQPTKKVVDENDFQLQSDIQTQILKEFGEELLGMHSLEKIDNQRELELTMKKNKTLNKLKKLLKEGKATLNILGVSLDIFRLRPELLTVLVIDDENFYNHFLPKISWEVSSVDKQGLGIYNIEDEEQYLSFIFDDKTPLVSPATACLKLGREYVLHNYIKNK